ncbi:hypothetical protein [Frankia sp. Cj3]|uniref:hypothetical protein n=1 Tax=Frankia sp. Cj3 TaxID=2880976 RepID=UPI001EF44A94|nr:hypothetical protein [Frankia sp. Cj3]
MVFMVVPGSDSSRHQYILICMLIRFRGRRWRQSPRIRHVIRPQATLPAVVLVLAASVACADPVKSPEQHEPGIGPVQQISEPSQIGRPIDTYIPSVQEIMQLRAVRNETVAKCLAAHGANAEIHEPPGVQEFLSAQQRDGVIRSGLYGFFDPVAAKTHGYSRPPGQAVSLTETGVAGPSEVSSECARKGQEAIGGTPLIIDETVLPDSGPPVPTNDSRYRAVVVSWAQCMAESGFRYNTPLDAIGDLQWRRPPAPDGSTTPASPTEITVASTDVDCKIKTNLVGIAVAVQSAYDNRYIESHAAQLVEFKNRILGHIRSAGK